jgi:hypothetical protein
MMLPAAASADEVSAPQLLLRAWVHEAMRTVADRLPDPATMETVAQQVSAALHLMYSNPYAEADQMSVCQCQLAVRC